MVFNVFLLRHLAGLALSAGLLAAVSGSARISPAVRRLADLEHLALRQVVVHSLVDILQHTGAVCLSPLLQDKGFAERLQPRQVLVPATHSFILHMQHAFLIRMRAVKILEEGLLNSGLLCVSNCFNGVLKHGAGSSLNLGVKHPDVLLGAKGEVHEVASDGAVVGLVHLNL